ncbi:unnamed protein product [Arctia plantaginis]|uniref:Spaetzle domain-containing protein n=1 Tax=Arctia plantaginis TaxID=874455 RepID=A0A8S0Z7T5_ARCPL|nr:unnamed protein product [Arctia plantaginis]
MFLCKSVLCAMALFLSTSCDASVKDADSIIKIPDECKGQHLCTIKPEGYHHLEAKIESWLPKYLVKNAVNVTKMDLQPRIGEIEKHSHNCQEEMEQGFTYTYFYNESNLSNYEILVQNEKFIQNIEVVKCRKLQPPLSADSNEQCFQHLGIKTNDLKSICQTIWATRPFFVFNKNRTGIIEKLLRIPVTCSCMVSYH